MTPQQQPDTAHRQTTHSPAGRGAQVAAVLNRFPGMRSTMVVSQINSHGEPMLLAYVSMLADKGTPYAELRAHLRDALPALECPVMFIRLDGLPPLLSLDRRVA